MCNSTIQHFCSITQLRIKFQWVLSIVCEIFYLKHVSFITKFPLRKLALDISSPLIMQNEQLTIFKGNLNLWWRLAAMWLLLTIAILLYLLTDVHQIWHKPSFCDEKVKVVSQGNQKIWSPVCADFFKSLFWNIWCLILHSVVKSK